MIAIGRPVWIFVVAAFGQDAEIIAGYVDGADIEFTVDPADENKLVATRRPVGRIVVSADIGQTADIDTIFVHDVDLRRTGTVGGKGNFIAGWRPAGTRFDGGRAGQASFYPAGAVE